ncbi:MAG TPA: type II secretion system F family protein [Phycisphaerae bacterium]|nr:type II secretion system F family protein [Phycisphaerae bacterium]
MIALLPLAAVFLGLAVALWIWAARDWISARFQRDIEWMRTTYLRFDPNPINARNYTLAYYAGFILLLILLVMAIPNIFVAIGFWLVSMLIPSILIEWAWRKRIAKIDLQIPQAVATLANSMRAGLTLVQAVTRLSEQAPEPIRSEFKIMANQYGYGADMETVIRNAKQRLNLQNFNLFASALILNREMGGDISDTLTRISKSLDKLREMRKTVEAHTSEGRTNIKVLLIAPVFMLLLMCIVDSNGVGMLFTTTQGVAILTVAGILAGSGVYLARRITKADI